ncbi:Lactaldehyde dehydrogenase [Lasiodiplodia theobromae]|uniref:aldehyde dehydrogenase (NAD(+)) n=1 Tax=Lasiodiplodia theobromae TaxID=45133 RepID=A0A5N5D9Z2_9PEZI|nr:Lactaldehyde dehydrogenase [Lasiodiplodia theobromae]
MITTISPSAGEPIVERPETTLEEAHKIFPYLIVVNSLIPALLAGNTVILKPSPQVPLVAERLVEIFADAGLPPRVLQLIYSGSPEALSEMVQFPEISLITFTGSASGGMSLREAVAKRLVPIVFELGGNDPAYVRADADLAWVAAQLVDGAVFNAGQSCCAVERVYVHADVYERFVEEVRKELATYVLGDPFDAATNVGPVISKAAAKNIELQVAQAIERGARDATPTNPSFETTMEKGNYIRPTILVDVDHTMRIMQEETFGPIIPIAKVESDEDAIALMNDSAYGLTASVWTKDVQSGESLIDKIEAGTVFINRCDYPSPVS